MSKPSKFVGQIREIAQEQCGYKTLYPGQEEALAAVAGGRDTLVVMPTGAGKSAIYQIAAYLMPGATVVVSPLIALQHDQVESIEMIEVGEAAAVNSTLRAAEKAETFARLQSAELEFLFLAPEQFNNQQVLQDLKGTEISLFVVDEAHCISEWGHDFRPDYLKLGAVIEELGHPCVLALTATASPPVREEIMERLGMKDAAVVVEGFDRPNIWLGVERFSDEGQKRQALVDRVKDSDKPGIVYAATRRHAEELAVALAEREINAVHYHAGLGDEERRQIQDAFRANGLDVIVATTAFGMGIDKPDVRFVYHYDIPGSVDAYYQEIGRAGRDGEPAQAILFYRAEDLGIRRYFAGGSGYDEAGVTRVVEFLETQKEAAPVTDLAKEMQLSRATVKSLLAHLVSKGAVEINDHNCALWLGYEEGDVVGEIVQDQARYEQMEASRIDMMRQYAELYDCRREYLLNYFGEAYAAPCATCDNCEAGTTTVDDGTEQPFALNSRVRHEKWGEGLVMRYEGDKITVLFDDVGYKALALPIVLDNELLEAA